eukprot:GILJ01012322.1.p1 GENE.GILJ01012322.1~~GILJ01012322.1.p1  ORF type:complete len:173 (-),score=14.64 GILJ01012322.1:305-823(-)
MRGGRVLQLVTAANKQTVVPVHLPALIKRTSAILKFVGVGHCRAHVLVATDQFVQTLNYRTRDVNKPTDVLSFQQIMFEKPGVLPRQYRLGRPKLGDIVIGFPYVLEQAKDFGESIDDRFDVLLSHSVCHLLGYDHERDDDYKLMDAKENEILAYLDTLKLPPISDTHIQTR